MMLDITFDWEHSHTDNVIRLQPTCMGVSKLLLPQNTNMQKILQNKPRACFAVEKPSGKLSVKKTKKNI